MDKDFLINMDDVSGDDMSKPKLSQKGGSFDWSGADLPELESHSEAKLEILREYLIDYIVICCRGLPPGVPVFSIYIIDGFCGGGVYEGGKQGSPVIMLKAVEEAEFHVNQGRTSKIKIEASYSFVDESKEAIAELKIQLEKNGYGNLIGNRIMIYESPFAEEFLTICNKLKKAHPRGGARALFFLDQCGYSKVPPQLIRKISNILPKAEFIVNFAVTWLSDFMGSQDGAEKLLESSGLSDVLDIGVLLKQREKEGKTNWAWTVESQISIAYQQISGMSYFSPFYISPENNHRGYWLLHLAPHPRARQAMVAVQWAKANRIRHFGKSGTGVLSYKPDENPTVYLEGVSFDDFEKPNVEAKLQSEIPSFLHQDWPDGVSFQNFMAKVCNTTNASMESIIESLINLHDSKDIEIKGAQGGKKRSGFETISKTDVITVPSQKWFEFWK